MNYSQILKNKNNNFLLSLPLRDEAASLPLYTRRSESRSGYASDCSSITSANSISRLFSKELTPPSINTDTSVDTATSASVRFINASTQACRIRKAACKILARFRKTPYEQLDDRNKKRIEWAKKNMSILPDDILSCSQGSEKRQHSVGGSLSSVQQGNKRTRFTSDSSNTSGLFSDADECFILAIVDLNKIDGSISPENWQSVKLALLNVYSDVIVAFPGPSPVCRDAGWHKGHIKLVACADKRSADLYKIAISRLGEVWAGAKLQAITRELLPSRPISKAWIPLEPSTPERILDLLKLSNSNLPTHDWKIEKLSEPTDKAREMLVILNAESIPHLEATRGVVNYGFGSILLRISKEHKRKKSNGTCNTISSSFDKNIARSDTGTITSSDVSSLVSSLDLERDLFRLALLTDQEDEDTLISAEEVQYHRLNSSSDHYEGEIIGENA